MENKNKMLLAIAVSALLAAGAFVGLMKFNLIGIEEPYGSAYQAVFLSNGQVYFGKLSSQKDQWLMLRDIYYLQTTQTPNSLQPGQDPPANINLVKLGGELHGPTDAMRINRDSVLFIEDLKGDSNIILAIDKLKAAK